MTKELDELNDEAEKIAIELFENFKSDFITKLKSCKNDWKCCVLTRAHATSALQQLLFFMIGPDKDLKNAILEALNEITQGKIQ